MKVTTNKNREIVDLIRKKLRDNDGYCPCAIEKTEDTKCMCKQFREQGIGYCHCGLYYKEEI
jgi:hypothetical protein